jgi:hypothetical protein
MAMEKPLFYSGLYGYSEVKYIKQISPAGTLIDSYYLPVFISKREKLKGDRFY